jgi:FkbM family methyltransferase
MEKTIINFLGKKITLWLRDEADRSVMREIFKLREYRVAEEKIAEALFPIIDAGAHSGMFSIYCRALNENSQIYAVEPEPRNLELLKKHLKENNIKNVEVVAAALSNETGARDLLISEDSHNHRLREKDENTDGEKIKIKVFCLPDFFKKFKLKKISLLKMDIEGAEFEIFESLSENDLSPVDCLILEYHNNKNRNHKEIEIKLRSWGFGVSVFPSKFDKSMGFIFANNKRK